MSYMQVSKERDVGSLFDPFFMLVTLRLGLERVLKLDFGCRIILESAVG